jgi:adenylate cyclase, class 2
MDARCIDIKAMVKDPAYIRDIVLKENYSFTRNETQIDTYFKVKDGRFKFREGVNNELIYYERANTAVRNAEVKVVSDLPTELKPVLEQAMGISCVVEKHREQYEKNNVYVRIDEVKNLGTFLEILCYDKNQGLNLEKQLEKLKKQFNIQNEDLIPESYSDLIMQKEV